MLFSHTNTTTTKLLVALKTREGQKLFFDKLAAELGFHPENQPHQWRRVSVKDVVSRKVCVGLLLVASCR